MYVHDGFGVLDTLVSLLYFCSSMSSLVTYRNGLSASTSIIRTQLYQGASSLMLEYSHRTAYKISSMRNSKVICPTFDSLRSKNLLTVFEDNSVGADLRFSCPVLSLLPHCDLDDRLTGIPTLFT